MKKFIAFCIFAIGMFITLPSTASRSGNGSPPDQVSFVFDHQIAVPFAAMLQDNYSFDQSGNVKYQNVINCRKGGGVEVQVLNLVTQPTYLINNRMKAFDFTAYCNYSFRTCLTDKVLKGQKIQKNIVLVHRFARDGLTQV